MASQSGSIHDGISSSTSSSVTSPPKLCVRPRGDTPWHQLPATRLPRISPLQNIHNPHDIIRLAAIQHRTPNVFLARALTIGRVTRYHACVATATRWNREMAQEESGNTNENPNYEEERTIGAEHTKTRTLCTQCIHPALTRDSRRPVTFA